MSQFTYFHIVHLLTHSLLAFILELGDLHTTSRVSSSVFWMWFYTYLYQWVFTFMLLKHILPFHINLKGRSSDNKLCQHLFFFKNLYCFFIFEEQLCLVLVGRCFFLLLFFSFQHFEYIIPLYLLLQIFC